MTRGVGHHIGSYASDAWPTFLDGAESPACQDAPAETFFEPELAAMAERVCAGCPLIDPCRDWALSRPVAEVYGVWGGTTQEDRKRMRRQVAA